MKRYGIGLTALTALAVLAPTPGSAIMAMPTILVGPPAMMAGGFCTMSIARPGGIGPGAAIPFRTLALGAPVRRTANSFITGGGGTSNAAIEAQRREAGLPWKPPTVNPESVTPPLTFAVDRGASMTSAPYQRLPLTATKRLADPSGLIFSQATSPSQGRIAALVLYMTGRPSAASRLRVTVDGPANRGCRRQVLHVYAPAMSAAALARLFPAPGRSCTWTNLSACTRAQWPHGRILFISMTYGTMFEYRWIDYDLLADWHFARKRS